MLEIEVNKLLLKKDASRHHCCRSFVTQLRETVHGTEG